MIRSSALLLLAAFAAAACMKAPDPAGAFAQGPAQPSMPPAVQPPAAAEAEPDAPQPFLMEAPEGWVAQPPDQRFYLAKWVLPGIDGGLCTVSATGGGIEANVVRWLGQFEVPGGDPAAAAVRGSLDGGNYPITTVVLEGTLTATRQIGGGPPRENWMLAGAVLEAPDGPVYVKALGPIEVLQADLEAFWEAVRGARINP